MGLSSDVPGCGVTVPRVLACATIDRGRKEQTNNDKATEIVWDCTRGVVIGQLTARQVFCLQPNTSAFIQGEKCSILRKVFSKVSRKIMFDTSFRAFELFLEMPKVLKNAQARYKPHCDCGDVENLLKGIEQAFSRGRIDTDHYLNYKAIVLFGAFTGQRPLATIARLTVEQFNEALTMRKPVVDVLPWQDKIRMQHYCPSHPQVVETMLPVLDGREDDQLVFKQLSFQEWVKDTNVRLLHGGARIVNGDLRKFCEQQSDFLLQWDGSNKNYILTHGVSGVDWRFYKSPRLEPGI